MCSSLNYTVFYHHNTFISTFLPLTLAFFYSDENNRETKRQSSDNWGGYRLQGGIPAEVRNVLNFFVLEMTKLQRVITFETFETVGVRGLGNGIPKHEIINTSKLIMCTDNSHGVFQ